MEYNRGSEWRRWEMHLHTPLTKKEDHFSGSTDDEKWDNFYSSITDYVGKEYDPLKAICAIAITDYLSIDNYLKVREDKRLPSCVKLLLPNVELRMIPVSKKAPLNIHCIFSDKFVDQINDRFFSKLKIKYLNNDYSALPSELIRLGRDFNKDNTLSDDEAYQMGLEQFTIQPETLTEIFESNPELRSNTIIVVSNGSSDGASGIIAHSGYFVGNISQLDVTRQSIYQLSDMIYSANPSDIDYFLGCGPDDEDTVKRKCGSLKPCIHGCDAHTNERIFEPVDKRYCWIKADTTFEGLKQILYEPKERVRVSSIRPDLKQDYHMVDRVEIIGNDNFSSQPIYFSENLSCIIGGKSTGKSLLLHNMALTLDKAQVRGKEKIATTNVKDISGLKIYWRDGFSNDEIDNSRKIVYIPQTYLNRLSDEKEETTEIDTIIQDIVLQDENANQCYLTMNENIVSHKQYIAKTILDFCQTVASRNKIIDAKKEIGDKDGIENEIKKLSSNLEKLSKEYNVTEDDIRSFQNATEQIQQISTKIKSLRSEQEFIESIESVLEKRDFSESRIITTIDTFRETVEKIQKIADDYWKNERKQIVEQIVVKLKGLENDLEENKRIVYSLSPKMEGNEQIGKISADIVTEKDKLIRIEQLNLELLTQIKNYDEQLSILSHTFESFKKFYTEYVDGVNSNFINHSTDLEFSVNCVLRTDRLIQNINNIINQKSKSRFRFFVIEDIDETTLTPDNIKLFIVSLLSNSSETLQLKGGHGIESALREILTDWFNIDYVVKMDNDSIGDMSPGKKALILLRLLISLAESKCPILIDQPEDDLDNRSIFEDLVKFIKKKKIDRQIIAVTHDANIVLGGDAELIIVANQEGKNTKNKKYRFEYRGGSIENDLPMTDKDGNIDIGILNGKGIQTHICEILEGGEQAFDLRKNKYHFVKK
jgi:ABC-type cobalamin/Fe3+-siderophores transport system ATPase subunit